jgi:hypothetical protein
MERDPKQMVPWVYIFLVNVAEATMAKQADL